ncbi:phasin family protein [Parendozoicomonas sp. Alg238-R29]|uniref:phasin family protein n=1 Tax=Parendozoicomonas sp. Alg238-R29 TaxID=2993446 RepID=UPI00248D5C87|nr:phasin family protein [Parendozoicomonas sp. Alg238-R29]
MYEKIWLAGLGAYARYEKFGTEGRKLFDELVEDGEDVRDRATDKVDDLKQKAQDKINETIARLKEVLRIKESEEEGTDDVQELSKQIEELSKAVKALTAAEKKPATRAAAKPAAKKAS